MIFLELLGRTRVRVNSHEIFEFPTEKVRGMLSFLALEAGQPHPRESLAGLFWPEQDAGAARNNVRKSLHRLRSLLDACEPGFSDRHFIVSRDHIQLDPATLWVDAHEVAQIIATTRSTQAPPVA